MDSNNIGNKKLTPSDYINHPEVVQCIQSLKSRFGENFENLIVSDTLDEEGHQYANLVQKGGGVLGVALVGYTYVLEQVGIRFLRLAGTSAGAINTSLLAVIGDKKQAKSTKILEYLCNLDFFNLVDGHPVARWLIKKIITKKKFEKNLLDISKFLGGSFLTALILLIILISLGHWYDWAWKAGMILFAITGILLLILIASVAYTMYLYKRLKESGYGINPGKFFYDWIKQVMEENGVSSVTELNAKASGLPNIRIRNPETQNADSLFGDVTFITAELVSENKIEFPRMYSLFRTNPDQIHPAGFVRASMSIPVFFESFTIQDIPQTQEIKAAWANIFSEDLPVPAQARFVDGGMLSNFPINIFYNPKIIEPRLPSFGIDLDDSDPHAQNTVSAQSWNLLNYIGRMFNTIRFYYDKDFLIKNRVFKKGIGSIPLAEFNWLNFFLSEEDKLKMFIRGAQTACGFLLSFDWKDYQKERIKMQQVLNEKNLPELTAAISKAYSGVSH